jgi:hypothetical protein
MGCGHPAPSCSSVFRIAPPTPQPGRPTPQFSIYSFLYRNNKTATALYVSPREWRA